MKTAMMNNETRAAIRKGQAFCLGLNIGNNEFTVVFKNFRLEPLSLAASASVIDLIAGRVSRIWHFPETAAIKHSFQIQRASGSLVLEGLVKLLIIGDGS